MKFLFNVLLFLSLFSAVGTVAEPVLIDAIVIRISDGDTVTVCTEDTLECRENPSSPSRLTIRVIGMDAPELHVSVNGILHSQGYWGEMSDAHIRTLLPIDTRVKIDKLGIDSYKRTLGRILYNGTDIGLSMIRSGWAIPYHLCPNLKCDSGFFARDWVHLYLLACRLARRSQLGIFDPAKPLTELPFEFRLRIQGRKPDKFVGDMASYRLFNPMDYKKVDLCRRIFFYSPQDAKAVGFAP